MNPLADKYFTDLYYRESNSTTIEDVYWRIVDNVNESTIVAAYGKTRYSLSALFGIFIEPLEELLR